MTIKAKMTVLYTLLMVVLAVLILSFMTQITSSAAENSAETILKTVVEKNESEVWYVDGRVRTFDFEGYQDGAYLQVYDKEGTLLEGFDPWEFSPVNYLEDRRFSTISTEDGTMFFYCERIWSDPWASSWRSGPSGEPWSSEEPDYVWLCAVLPAANMTAVSHSVIRAAYIALPILMLLAIAGSWFITNRSLEPLRKITESAHDISTGDDLSRRIEIGPGKDELHTLADTFNDMLSRLERSFISERQFTSDASHELRTPTAVILAECGMAKKMPDDPAELRQSLGVVERQARKMSSLVSRLLTFTRLEQGTQKIKMEELDLSELAMAVCEEQRTIGGAEIITEIEPDVLVRGDGELLMILLQNLMSNARKYGKPDGHIWVSLSKNGGMASLTVRDDGIGIAEDVLPRIWDRFFQADPSRTNRDGSLGLGLSMVKEIARLHGGDVTARSSLDIGSTFTFTLTAL